MDNLTEDDDVIFIDDVEEVINTYDTEDSEKEYAIQREEDGIFVFRGHELGTKYSNGYNHIDINPILVILY